MARIMGSNFFNETFPKSVCERSRQLKQIETIRNFVTTLKNLYDIVTEKTNKKKIITYLENKKKKEK